MLRSGVKPKDDKNTHSSSASKVPLPQVVDTIVMIHEWDYDNDGLYYGFTMVLLSLVIGKDD